MMTDERLKLAELLLWEVTDEAWMCGDIERSEYCSEQYLRVAAEINRRAELAKAKAWEMAS